jgi:hypothetical protein
MKFCKHDRKPGLINRRRISTKAIDWKVLQNIQEQMKRWTATNNTMVSVRTQDDRMLGQGGRQELQSMCCGFGTGAIAKKGGVAATTTIVFTRTSAMMGSMIGNTGLLPSGM